MPKSNEKLGRNLSDLLNDESLRSRVELLQKQPVTSQNKIPLDKIVANPFQPRQTFDEDKLNELAASIKEHGVFTPILVRYKDGVYQIVAGERRYRASLLAGMKTIPAIIESFNDKEMNEIALIENIQRENLSPLEEAKAYAEMQKNYNYTQQEIAQKVGKSRSYIANILRLRQLPEKIQQELTTHNLSVGHVRTLIGLDEQDALEFLEKIKSGELNVRDTEKLLQEKKLKRNRKQLTKQQREKKLEEKLNTKVTLSKSEIKIKFNSEEELKEILSKIMNSKK